MLDKSAFVGKRTLKL